MSKNTLDFPCGEPVGEEGGVLGGYGAGDELLREAVAGVWNVLLRSEVRRSPEGAGARRYVEDVARDDGAQVS